MSEDDLNNIRAAIFAGRKIDAIKHYRKCTGQGLKEAKDAVELLEAELRRVEPERFTAPPSAKGCVLLILVVLATMGVVVELI